MLPTHFVLLSSRRNARLFPAWVSAIHRKSSRPFHSLFWLACGTVFAGLLAQGAHAAQTKTDPKTPHAFAFGVGLLAESGSASTLLAADGNPRTGTGDESGKKEPKEATAEFDDNDNATEDEFVGPFESWLNLKTDFGARGDGTTDDTQALQAALNEIVSNKRSPALWIPDGTYRITKTLTLAAGIGLSVIGEDPVKTSIKWAGPSDGVLLHIDGVSHSRITRITFDGSGSAGVLVDQSLTSYEGGRRFDTGNEYSDDVFRDGGVGLQGGQFDLGAAEVSILRSKFLNLRGGIALKNFNALDWWIWSSYFENNNVGVSNNLDEKGAGNFHIYRSIFTKSRFSDIYILNTGQFNFRDNWSIDSMKFLIEKYYYDNAATTRLQGNTIFTAEGNDCGGCGAYVGNMGPLVMTDNVWVSPRDATNTAVYVGSLKQPDCISVGNTYTIKDPVKCAGMSGAGRLFSVDDKIVEPQSIDRRPPLLTPTPQKRNRRIFEVPAQASSETIQRAIDAAAAYCGQRPIVHLAHGAYALTQTLTIPADCDIQLIGDGFQPQSGTGLIWQGNKTEAALRLLGPSRAILKDFAVNAKAAATGIEVLNADQVGSRILADHVMADRSIETNILVDELDHALVEFRDVELAYTATPPAMNGTALKIIGGRLAAMGQPQDGRTNLLSGSGGGNFLSFDATNGASLIVRDFWLESNQPGTYAHVSAGARVTLEGSRMAIPMNEDSVKVEASAGFTTVLSSAPDAPINAAAAGGEKLFVFGNNFGQAKAWWPIPAPAASAFNLNRRMSSQGSTPIPDSNEKPDANFVRMMLAQSRQTHPSIISALPSGVTDLRLFRVSVEFGTVGIRVRH